jgi:hypothetical protein
MWLSISFLAAFPSIICLLVRASWAPLSIRVRAFLNLLDLIGYLIKVLNSKLLSSFVVVLRRVISGSLVLSLSLLALFLSLCVPSQLDLLLLVSVQILIFIKCMLAQISHVNVDFGLVGPHILVDLPHK